MSFRTFILPAISIICALLLFFLFRFFVGYRPASLADGYAVLTMHESQDDRYIQELLSRAGFSGVISESSQVVFLDDFGSLLEIPLDLFYGKLESFDPRNDGYPEKKRAFFVRDGMRNFFIPKKEIPWAATAELQNRLIFYLENRPFSLMVLGYRQGFYWFFVFLGLACLGAFVLSKSKRLFVFVLPVLLALGWTSFYSLVLAALFAGIWELLREPIKEFFAASCYERKNSDYAGAGFKGMLERLRPFRLNLLLVLLFTVLLVLVAAIARLNPIPLAAMFACFSLLYYLSFKRQAERALKTRHIPFTPVLLMPLAGSRARRGLQVKTKTFSFFPFLFPFALMSLIAFSLGAAGFMERRQRDFLQYESDWHFNNDYFLSSRDFYAHFAFQSGFSFRPLNRPERAFLHYYLGEDGLIAGSYPAPLQTQKPPRFPLEELMQFLIDYDYYEMGGGRMSPQAPYERIIRELIAVFILLAVFPLDLIRPGGKLKKTNRIPDFRDKRIAA